MHLYFAAVLAAVGPPAFEEATAQPRWEVSLAEALKRARKENRLVVVDFWRDNCIFCVRMEQETFVDQRVKRLLGDYVAVRAKNTDHPTEIERYKVEGFPTLAVLDAEGRQIEVNVGYMGPAEFITWVGTAADHHRRLSSLTARIAVDPGDLGALLALGKLHAGDGKREEARACFEKVVKADPDGKARETAEAHLEMGLTWRRSRDYRRAVESLSRARDLAVERVVRALGEGPAAESKGGKAQKVEKADGKAPPRGADADLLERALHELATAQVLGGMREGLLKTLEEFDAKLQAPDARRHAWVLLTLGETRVKTGARDAARAAFMRCDKLYPNSPEARQCREALAALP